MTEYIPGLREDTPDLEDTRLHGALAELQGIVDSFLARTGKSVNDLSEDEQQELADRIDPHLAFELSISDDIYMGLPIATGGPGGFLLADSEGALLGAQQTTDGDVITGIVSAARAYPVPSRKIMLEPTEPGEGIGVYDQSLSAVLILEDVKFHTDPSDDGSFQIVHDLSGMKLILPVIYGMNTRVIDIVT